jgi:hypothetical protein
MGSINEDFRLNGLFIWAIDLDTTDHRALQAVLGGKLGAFSGQNGVGSGAGDFKPLTGNQCVWSGTWQDPEVVISHRANDPRL